MTAFGYIFKLIQSKVMYTYAYNNPIQIHYHSIHVKLIYQKITAFVTVIYYVTVTLFFFNFNGR